MQTLKKLFGTRWAFWVIVAVFLLQALIFAGSINRNIPPDEGFHIGFIEYYSQQPISAGPFIHHQSPQSFNLGDVERTPNYMYHYVLGLVVKGARHVIHSEAHIVYLLRFINILLALAALVVLKKVFDELNVDRIYQNITFALLVSTTAFIEISAAVNYDNATFLVVSLLLLELFRFLRRYSAIDFMWLIILGGLGLLVKFEFSVVLTAAALVILAQLIRDKKMLKALGSSFTKVFAQQRLLSLTLVVLAILSTGLVGERYGGNIVRYHTFTPVCTQIHTDQECRQNMIYSRDVDQSTAFAQFIKNGGQIIYSPFGFVGDWLTQMYNSLFFYLGQKFVINPGRRLQNMAAIFIVLSLGAIAAYYKRGTILTKPEDRKLAFITGFYVLALFLLNLNSYLHSASFYGFQGRYLLPAMPFIFLFFVRGFVSMCQTLKRSGRPIVPYVLIAYMLVLIYLQMPILVLYRGAAPSWFSGSRASSHLNAKIQNELTTLRIAKKGSLPSTSAN